MIFKCKNCGGQVTFSPTKMKMVCLSCDGEETDEQLSVDNPYICMGCGAQIEVEKFTSATKCSHCGKYVILDKMITYPYGPDLVIPFKIDKEKAASILKDKFKRTIFTPNDFLREKTLDKMSAEYVPFWLYNYNTDVDFSGIGIKVRHWTSGNTEYTETSKYQVTRKLDIDFNRIPVDASIKMDDGIMDLMEPYDYQGLKNFSPKFLSGYYSEAYNYTPNELEPRAQKKATEDAASWLKGTTSQYTRFEMPKQLIRNNKTGNEFALLPVWFYDYRYRGKNYKFYINGETGKLYGAPPFSIGKMIGFTSILFASAFALLQAFELLMEVL